MRIFILIISFLLSTQAFSARFYKQAHADSLKKSLEEQKGKERIHTLIHLADCYYQIQLDSASNFALMAKKESKQLDYAWGEHKGNYQQIKVEFLTKNLGETLTKIQTESSWFKENDFPIDAIRCGIIEGYHLYLVNSIEKAIEHCYAVLQEAKKTRNTNLLGDAWYLYHLVQAKQLNGEYFQASLDSAFFYCEMVQDSLGLINIQNRRYEYSFRSEFISSIYKTLDLSRRWNNARLENNMQRFLSFIYGVRNNPDSSSFYLQKGLISAKKYGSKLSEASLYYNIAYCNYKFFEDFPEAIEWSLKSIEIANRLGCFDQSYKSSKLLAKVYKIRKEYPSATLYYLEANRIAKQLKHPYYINTSLVSLVNIYRITKNFKEAEELYLETIDFAEKKLEGRVKQMLLVGANTQLAYLFKEQGKAKEALKILESAFKSSLNINRMDAIGIGIQQMKICLDIEQMSKADEMYIRIKQLFKELKRPYSTDFQLQVGRLYFAKQLYSPCITAVKKFIENSPQKEVSEDRRDAYELLYKAYDNLGSSKLALQNHIAFKTISDSIKNANSIENVALIQSRYETAEKEAELLKAKQEKEIQAFTVAQQETKLKQQQQNIFLTVLAFIFILSVGILLFIRYHLQKKNKELALQSKQLELEKRQEQTKQQLQLAELRSDFFSNTSHEFRTPLTLTLGPLDKLLKKEQLEYRGDVERIQRNAKRLLSLVDETLDIAKIENGHLPLSVNKIAIGEYVSKIAHGFIPHAETKQISLEVIDRSGQYQLEADENKLNKVCVNLLENAFKHTPNGGFIQVICEAPKENSISIQIKDNGAGIASENIPYIFNRFYKVDANTEGTGIGLALSKQLIELHGGTILVESKIGKGSTFSVQIPLRQPDEIKHVLLKEDYLEPLIPIDSPFIQKGKTILIIEDNDDVRLYLEELLVENYKIVLAADGQEGIRLAEEKNPDLIISDVMMPKKDGFELTKYLKQNLSTSHIPIILLTAKASLESKVEGLETGADDYL
ncbi:MAG: response regulator, partial [Flavobacteriales bacterium]|nr:response regulator [Flavobacteriales bacterium]